MGLYLGAFYKSQEIVFKTNDDHLRAFYFQPRAGLVFGRQKASLEAGVYYDMPISAYGTPGSADADAVVQTASVAFNPLSPGRLYELRVRTRCSDTLHGDWEMLQFFTLDTTFPPDTTIVPPDTTIVPPDTTIVPPDTTVSIRDQFSTLNSQFSVFPNPAHGQCVVDLVAVKEAELRLYTLDGRLLYALVTRDPKITLLLPRSGVFLLQVITPEGVLSRKIVNR